MQTLKQHCTEYFEACYGHQSIPFTQAKELRQAFFAGALSAFSEVFNASKLPESDGEQRVEAICDEINTELVKIMNTRNDAN